MEKTEDVCVIDNCLHFNFFFCNTSRNDNTEGEQNIQEPTDIGRADANKYYDECSLKSYCNFS